ncbi:unnamed protein product, partial [Rotaria sp. Silwood2]
MRSLGVGASSEATSYCLLLLLLFLYIDDIFVASANITDLSPTDLQEINIEMLNDTQHSTSRNTVVGRNHLKQNLQIPFDSDTSNTQTGSIT